MKIHEWLQRELTERGLAHQQLGAAVGWDQSTTSKVMNGHRQVKADELIVILKWLGYPSPLDFEKNGSEEAAVAAILAKAGKMNETQRKLLMTFLEALVPPPHD